MNKQQYYRWVLKQCENPKRSTAIVTAWGIAYMSLGIAAAVLIYHPAIYSNWNYIIIDLYGGGALLGIGGICIKQALHRRDTIDLIDKDKLMMKISEQGGGEVRS